MKAVTRTTAISTTTVEVTTSCLSGQATFFSSARTSRENSLTVIRSRCGGGGAGRRRSAGGGVSPPWRFIWRLVCRFTAASVRSGPVPSRPVEQGRRESNPQPPVLETGALPIELLPSDALGGASGG